MASSANATLQRRRTETTGNFLRKSARSYFAKATSDRSAGNKSSLAIQKGLKNRQNKLYKTIVQYCTNYIAFMK